MTRLYRLATLLTISGILTITLILTVTAPTAQGDTRVPARSHPPLPTLTFLDGPRRPALIIHSNDHTTTVWKAPPLTLLHRIHHHHGTWDLSLVPTGAETDKCVYTVTLSPQESTWQIITGTWTCSPENRDLPPPSITRTHSFQNTAHPSLDEGVTLEPPSYIRVRHDPRNTCRDVPPGHIDVIPFEEYVARVVPAEMPALWPIEALKAQAIAVRTYAWYHILHPYPEYDVSDWVDNQVMCDQHHPRSDLAVEATRGQILVYRGSPIVAFYSAQNGHPTLDDPWDLPYIAPIPDPVSLNSPRRGHGWGLSQVGAARWAQRGWNAYQILAHYYPNTTLSVPPDTPRPVGTLLPLELEDMTLGHAYPLYLFVGTPRPLNAITVTAHLGDTTAIPVITRTHPITTFLGVWEPPKDLSSTKPIVLDVQVEDISHTITPLGHAQIYRFPHPPTLTVQTVTETVDPRIVLDIDLQPETGTAPLIGIGEGWLWEERAFSWVPKETGHIISDTHALDGRAWQHPGNAPNGILYGPYTSRLRPGQSYRAWFRLAAGDVGSPNVIAFLDVVEDTGKTLLGLRALRGIEFPAAGAYREFPVDFHLFPRTTGEPRRVEFRVHALAPITLTLDRVLVTTYPQTWEKGAQWHLEHQSGIHTLTVKATNLAGAVSADSVLSVTLAMPAQPITFTFHPPSGWITSNTPLLWDIHTAVAPPNPERFAYRYSRDRAHWSTWFPLRVMDVYSRGGTLSLSPSNLPDATSVWVQVRGEDMFTYEGISPPAPVSVDLHPPRTQVTLTIEGKVYARWSSEDATGITGYDVEVWQEGIGWRPWFTHTLTTESTLEVSPGTRVAVRARSHDAAGWIGPWSTPVTRTVPYRLWTPHILQGTLNGAGTP